MVSKLCGGKGRDKTRVDDEGKLILIEYIEVSVIKTIGVTLKIWCKQDQYFYLSDAMWMASWWLG